jgi:type I restriction enzyme S subunit
VSFPRYSNYLDSGLNWLGDVPSHWSIRRLGYYLGERREKVSDRDYPPLSVTKDGIVPQLETAAKTDDGDNRKRVCKGDFVINSRSDRKGSAGLSALDGSVSLISTVLKPKESVHGSFVHHLLRSAPFQEEFYRFGKGIVADLWSTNYTAMSGITLAMPPFREQVAIATFLDRETAKIDALIAEQQRLIELLQEKRQAVISHAVTKGLNPDAPMKDSGVEWLGEVPEHWRIKRIKHTARMESGHTPDRKIEAYWINCDIPWVSLNDTGFLRDNDYISETAYYINELGIQNSSARLLPERVVVFSRDATIGRCAITTRPMAVSQHFIAWVCGNEILPEYLLLRLKSMTQELERLTFGATLKTIGMPDVKTLATPVPPIKEQEQIVEYAKEATVSLENMSASAQKAVALLQERRSALISAAVTGQIDVRGLVPEAEVA